MVGDFDLEDLDFFFLIPGIISLIIAGNFYRKSVTGWVRSLYPDDEMEIENYYVTDEEDENIIEYPCEHGHFSGESEEECH